MREFADAKSQNAERIEWMKKTAARVEIRVNGNEGTKLALGTQPVMRWDNDRARVVDASAFVWFDEHRPQVIGGIWIKNGHATFELQSLSSEPLTATMDGISKMVDVAAGYFVGGRDGRTATGCVARRTTAANETACQGLQTPRSQDSA